ncbi:MAG: protein kinase [Gemmataceae bacterium]|nr:protein kinase [Gemmataceae bacterium]
MSKLDAASVAQQAIRLNLLTLDQTQQGWDELGKRNGDPESFLLVMERKGYLTPWQSSKLLKGDPDGYFLGGYRILYKIASGSFGRVYRADDPRSGNVVAIKVLRRKWSDNKHNIELFEREGKVGMTLRHPNVVEILAVNRDPVSRQYFIVMEFVEGYNMRDYLTTRKKLEPAEALRIIEEAASGLAYAFSKGLTHRDMKLTNILLSSQRVAKLVDFGLAGEGPRAAKPDEIQVDRTVDYAGLEKATGVPPGDVRSDLYFLGCVLYELLTGRAPLEITKDPRARMRRERFSQVKPIEPEEVGGQRAVIRLVGTMMSLNPQERFQTPSQLLDAVREVRRELEGGGRVGPAAAKAGSPSGNSVFIVEKDERLQDVLRDRLKGHGYRVFLAADPLRALDRYRQQPYDALIVDARTTGDEGRLIFDRVLKEADRHHAPCAGILILAEEQKDWKDKVEARERIAILLHPVTMKQLSQKLQDFLGAPAKSG